MKKNQNALKTIENDNSQPEEYFDEDHLQFVDGTEVLYDSFPEGTDFAGIVVKDIIYNIGKSKVQMIELGVSTSIKAKNADNIRVILLGDE